MNIISIVVVISGREHSFFQHFISLGAQVLERIYRNIVVMFFFHRALLLLRDRG